jgi:hypothetical protein
MVVRYWLCITSQHWLEEQLVCDECRDRLDAEMEFVRPMRRAAAKIRYQELS